MTTLMSTNVPSPSSQTEDATLLGRVPILNLWVLLLYAWDQPQCVGDLAQLAVASGPDTPRALLLHLLGVLAHQALGHGMPRQYVPRQEARRVLRGRLMLSPTVATGALARRSVVCAYTQFHEDTLLNQLIKATLRHAACWLRGHASPPAGLAEAATRLASVLRLMAPVSDVPLRREAFHRVVIHRNNRQIHALLTLCRLWAHGALPSESAGSNPFLRLLREEVRNTPCLFERFLTHFYRHHVPPDHYGVQGAKTLHWGESPTSDYFPKMLTDVSFHATHPDLPHVVLDAKYYAEALVGRTFASQPDAPVAERIRSAHLYQLYAYLRTQEHHAAAHRHAKGILLYPQVYQGLDECVTVQGHPIHVATLDLAQPWPVIHDRLLSLLPRPVNTLGSNQSDLLMNQMQI